MEQKVQLGELTMSTGFEKQVFRRSAMWLFVVGWSLYVFGGWLLWVNVSYTMQGLANDGWNDAFAVSAMGCAIASVEAGVRIFLTQPENWDGVWGSMEQLVTDGDSRGKTPGWISSTLIAIILVFILAMCFGAYAFDFFSTFQGIYPDQEYTAKRCLFTLGLNFGTELCAFLGHQVLRMHKVARLEQLNERMYMEPQFEFAKGMREHRIWLAQQQARTQIQRERKANQGNAPL
jgi:hypothetical protein